MLLDNSEKIQLAAVELTCEDFFFPERLKQSKFEFAQIINNTENKYILAPILQEPVEDHTAQPYNEIIIY